jgi:hypothetical protein
MKRPIGLLLTTIILGFIALTELLSSIGMAVTGLMGSHATPPAPSADVPIPPHAVGSIALGFSLILTVILALLAGWAIFTIVGLLRLRNWGRISVLILGACLAVLSVMCSLGFIFLLFAQLFLTPSSSPPLPYSPHVMAFFLGSTALFYAMTAAIGIWWLVYFNRAAIKALFVRTAIDIYAQPQSIDPSYLPSPATPGRFDHVPAAIVIVACFFLLSTLACALIVFAPFPAFLCGFMITGPTKYIIYLTFAAISGYIGYGLLHLDNRARLATLAFLGFSLVNMGCLFLPWGRTQFNLYNQQIMQKFQIAGGPAAAPTPDLSYLYMIFGGVFVVLFNGFLFWLLQRHREAFLSTNQQLAANN